MQLRFNDQLYIQDESGGGGIYSHQRALRHSGNADA
jgi:hypothetical protein